MSRMGRIPPMIAEMTSTEYTIEQSWAEFGRSEMEAKWGIKDLLGSSRKVPPPSKKVDKKKDNDEETSPVKEEEPEPELDDEAANEKLRQKKEKKRKRKRVDEEDEEEDKEDDDGKGKMEGAIEMEASDEKDLQDLPTVAPLIHQCDSALYYGPLSFKTEKKWIQFILKGGNTPFRVIHISGTSTIWLYLPHLSSSASNEESARCIRKAIAEVKVNAS